MILSYDDMTSNRIYNRKDGSSFQNTTLPLQWRLIGRDSVSNHQPHECLLNRLFRLTESLKALCHWPLCGEITGTGEFPTQRASYAEHVSIWRRHHDMCMVDRCTGRRADEQTDGVKIQTTIWWFPCGLYHPPPPPPPHPPPPPPPHFRARASKLNQQLCISPDQSSLLLKINTHRNWK